MVDHLPINIIEKTGTPERYMAIAAPEQIDFVPISDRWMPSLVSPLVTTPSRHKSAIIFCCCVLQERLENFHLFPCKT